VPLHWQYDVAKVSEAIAANGGVAEFLPRSQCPFYSVATGSSSMYGDLALTGLRSLVGNGGVADGAHFHSVLQAVFGPGSAYADAVARRPAGRPTAPVPGPWRPSSVTKMLATGIADPETTDTDGMCVALVQAVLVAVSTDSPIDGAVLPLVTAAVSKPDAVAYSLSALRIVAAVVRGAPSIRAAVEGELAGLAVDSLARAALATVLSSLESPYSVVAPTWGTPCANPASLQCALHAAATSSNYSDAVRAIIAGGGDSCSRALLAGALHGALGGLAAVPQSWSSRAANASEALRLATALAHKPAGKVVVVGASGSTGGPAVAALVRVLGAADIVVATRNPDSPAAEGFKAQGVTVVAGDMSDPERLKGVLAGARLAYIITPGTEVCCRRRLVRVLCCWRCCGGAVTVAARVSVTVLRVCWCVCVCVCVCVFVWGCEGECDGVFMRVWMHGWHVCWPLVT
jgi:hypothetical protein